MKVIMPRIFLFGQTSSLIYTYRQAPHLFLSENKRLLLATQLPVSEASVKYMQKYKTSEKKNNQLC